MTMGTSVESLYKLISEKLDLKPDDFELVCYGRILNRDKTLACYGIRSSSVLYVFKKRNTEVLKIKKPEQSLAEKPNQQEVHRIVVALRTALVNPDFRKVIDRLSEKESQDNLKSVTPGLAEDPIAMAILQNFDLLTLCTEHDNISKVLELHPSFGLAATCLAAQFHEEHASADIFRRSPRSAYSLDDDVDDEEDEEEGEAGAPSGSHPVASTSNSQSSNSYTSADLAHLLRQALADANAGVRAASGSAGPSTSISGNREADAAPGPVMRTADTVHSADASVEPPIRITPEMLRHALSSVLSGSTTSGVSAADASIQSSVESASRETQTPGPAETPAQAMDTTPAQRDWTRELQQIRELGFLNDAVSIQALEATSGDLQLALDIIFNQ